MKYIKSYKLFEGGGAGKHITFDNIDFELWFTYKDGKSTLVKNEFDLGESFTLEGYQEYLTNIDTTDMFDSKLNYTIHDDKIGDLTIGDLRYYVGDHLFEDKNKEMTLRELSKEEELDIRFTGSGTFKYLHGGGYILAKIDTESVMFQCSADELDDGYEDLINDIDLHNSLISKDVVDIDFELTAKERMVNLWDELFDQSYFYSDYEDDYDGDEEDKLPEELWYEDRQDQIKYDYQIQED